MSSRHVSSFESYSGGYRLKAVVLARRLARVSTAFCVSRHKRCVDTSAEAKQQRKPHNTLHARHLFVTSVSTLKKGLWPICWVYIAQSVLLFGIERCTQRLTNACFLLLQGSTCSAPQIGSLWWLSVDPAITDFSTGYSYISFAFMCLSFPIAALVSCIGLLALFRIASEAINSQPGANLATTAPAPPPSPRLAAAQASAAGPVQSSHQGGPPAAAPDVPGASSPAGASGAAAAAAAAAPGKAEAASAPAEPAKEAEAKDSPAMPGMPPSEPTHAHDSPSNPNHAGKDQNGAPRQEGLVAAAQAAYSLLSDDSDSGSGSDAPLSGSQGAVGVAEQQIAVDAGDAGDKSAPGKQKGKAGAEAGGAAVGGAATAATAAVGAADGGGAAAAKGADGRAAGVTQRQRPRLWSVKKAGATVAAVVREDVSRVFTTYLLVSVFEAAVFLASTVFVTLPLTIPRLLNVQLAVPLAAMEGAVGREAMADSKARMFGYRRTAAAMLGLVFVLQKALPPLSAVLISALPPNVLVQVPEAVVVVLLAGQVLLFGASQLKGLVALLIYNHTANQPPTPALA